MSVEPSISNEASSSQQFHDVSCIATSKPSFGRKRRGNLPAIQLSNTSRRFGSSSSSLSSDSSNDFDDLSSDDSKRGRFESYASLDSDGFCSTFSLTEGSSTSLLSFDQGSCSRSRCGRLLLGGKRSGREAFVPLKNGQKIGNYHVIGAGKEARAVYTPTKTVVACQSLTATEAETIQKVSDRLGEATRYYHKENVDEMRELVLPASAELIEERLEEGTRYVLFTPLHQSSLHNFAKEKGTKMTEVDVKPLFYQIVDLVTFCHAIGIILRDLKPGKLVFAQPNVLRLSNVNDCIVLDDPLMDEVQEKCGSPAYVPPEVLEPGIIGYSGKAADIWGLGILLYLLLLGRYPFYDTTPIGVFQKIKHAKVVIPPTAKLTYGARALIFGLLRREPTERPSAAELQFIPWAATPTPCRLKDMAHDITARINNALDGISNGIRSAIQSSSDNTTSSSTAPATSTTTVSASTQNVPSYRNAAAAATVAQQPSYRTTATVDQSQQRRAPFDLQYLLTGISSAISRTN